MAAGRASDRLLVVADLIPSPIGDVFPFETFNKVQTDCAEAFNSDANMTVSAPTGSGKTAIFEMAICRLLHKRLPSSDINPGLSGKVVYLAPIRALCTEKKNEWEEKFSQFGLNVVTLSNDDWHHGRIDVSRADIILSTPEKFDSVTRSDRGLLAHSLMATVSLLLIDEMHHVGDSRGSALEAVVARMLLTSDELKSSSDSSSRDLPGASLRIIAVSATIPNILQIAQWLRVDRVNCKTFSESHRPVPLEYKVLGYRATNKWTFNQYLSQRCFEVVQRYSSNRPTIVFCTSRKLCATSARTFAEKMFEKGFVTSINQGNALTSCLTLDKRAELCEASISDTTNSELLRHGIAVHHAAISESDRGIIEDLFRRQLVRVMFTTTTLAQGVNLPARLCVILGTSVYQKGAMVEIDKNMVMQSLGRAGRPQFDDRGVAIVMTSMQNVALYEKICSGKHGVVHSQLKGKLPEHLNAEIARGIITDIPTAILWMRSTFLYVCEREHMKGNSEQLETATKDLVVKIVNGLAEYRIVQYDDEAFGVFALNASTLMARNYISFETMKTFISNSNTMTSEAGVLKVLASAAEFSDLFLRRSEKKLLNAISKAVRFPLRSKVSNVRDKVFLLFQVSLSGKDDILAGDFNLRSEMRKIAEIGVRIAKTLSLYLVENEERLSYTSSISALHVSRALMNGVFWDGGQVIRQLKGIGPVIAQKLIAGGVHSIRDFAAMDARQIENTVSKNPPFGNELLSSLEATIPRYRISVTKLGGSEVVLATGRGGVLKLRVVVSRVPWDRQKKSMEKMDLQHVKCETKGFVLVGTHAGTNFFYETFRFLQRDKSFEISVPVAKSRTSKWIEVCVAPEDYCGADVSHKVHIPGSNDIARMQATGEVALGEVVTADAEAETSPDENAVACKNGKEGDIMDLTIPSPESSKQERSFSKDCKAQGSDHAVREDNVVGTAACRHKCRNKQSCKHSCCKRSRDTTQGGSNYFDRTMYPAAPVLVNSPNRTRLEPGKVPQRTSRARQIPEDSREDWRRYSRPLTATLPVKRLRDSSNGPNTAAFAGTRLAAFFRPLGDEKPKSLAHEGRRRGKGKQSVIQKKEQVHPSRVLQSPSNTYGIPDGLSSGVHEEDDMKSFLLGPSMQMSSSVDEGSQRKSPEALMPVTETGTKYQQIDPNGILKSKIPIGGEDGSDDSYSSIFKLLDKEFDGAKGVDTERPLPNVLPAATIQAIATSSHRRELGISEQGRHSPAFDPAGPAEKDVVREWNDTNLSGADAAIDEYNDAFLRAFR